MRFQLDARVPVLLGPADPHPEDAWLAEDGRDTPAEPVATFELAEGVHPVDCACCGPRSPAAEALGRMFMARARGELPWFRRVRVAAGEAGREAVRQALAGDPLVSLLYRAEG